MAEFRAAQRVSVDCRLLLSLTTLSSSLEILTTNAPHTYLFIMTVLYIVLLVRA